LRKQVNTKLRKAIITKNQSTGIHVEDVDVKISHHEEEASPYTMNSNSDEEDEGGSSSEGYNNKYDKTPQSEESETPQSDSGDSHTVEDDSSEFASDRPSRKTHNENEFLLIGETHIDFHKILIENISDLKILENVILDSYTIRRTKREPNQIKIGNFRDQTTRQLKHINLWHYGVNIGQLEIIIQMNMIPFIRQMPLGVLTGTGILTTSGIPEDDLNLNLNVKKSQLPKEYTVIINAYQAMKKRDTSRVNKQRTPYREVEQKIKEVIEILK
jgi:hypothetical protein